MKRKLKKDSKDDYDMNKGFNIWEKEFDRGFAHSVRNNGWVIAGGPKSHIDIDGIKRFMSKKLEEAYIKGKADGIKEHTLNE